MTGPSRTSVAIVGGGPVGLMLALFLDRYGIESVVLNSEDAPQSSPRGNTHNARTMEHYRRLGISGAIRQLGLPQDHPTDIAYFTRYSAFELSRLALPTPGERMRTVLSAPRTDQTPEPVHRANQMYVEKFLFAHAASRPGITMRFGRQVREMRQDETGVTLVAERPDGGGVESWRAPYAVGCDGGRSFVRRTLGFGYVGQGSLDQEILGGRATAAHLRLPTFHTDVLTGRRAWSYWALNPELVMNLIALNGEDEFFLLTSSLDPRTTDHGQIAALVRGAAGAPLPVEVLSHRAWTPGAALVAERMQHGRIFLAGDAAHLFTPNGGFGMNTGVDDAANLAWKLAARTRGWGGPALLDSYESERRAIALRNTAAARELNTGLGNIDRPEALEAHSTRGEEARRRTGAQLSSYGERTHSIGVQLGARYDGSPLVVSDEEPPSDSMGTYTPTSIPGGRAPHMWLDEWRGPGSSLFDRFGAYYTLLRLGPEPPAAEALQKAAQAQGMPLKTVDLDDQDARDLYERDLVLVRPDQHVAWRGNDLPMNPDDLVARVTGQGPVLPDRDGDQP